MKMKLDELNASLAKHDLSGFWNNRTPDHKDEAPFIWKWKEVYPCLMDARESVGLEMAERRAIRLVNPENAGRATSRTLLYTFSVVNPGEIARPHRHNMTAIRFVVKGKDAYTVVDGERFPMEEGDLILTPNWTWHEHHNESQEPIVWLDGLDGPIINALNVLFFEEYDKDTQGVTRSDGDAQKRYGFARPPTSDHSLARGLPFRYKWADTYASLKNISDDEADPYDGHLIRYINPATGGYTLATMSCEAQLLKPGWVGKTHRHTSTSLYHVFKGRGRTAVGEGFLEWEKGDSFMIPNWQWHRHENLFEEEAVVFSINDRPVLEKLELYREEN